MNSDLQVYLLVVALVLVCLLLVRMANQRWRIQMKSIISAIGMLLALIVILLLLAHAIHSMDSIRRACIDCYLPIQRY